MAAAGADGNRFTEVAERDAGREPCPDRIVEDLGGAFGMGCIGGFIWHFVKGARNSPKGERFVGAMFAAKGRAPILGGNFAVWGGTFSTVDCTLQYIRRADDHWNNIAAGFLTGGVLAARGGWKQAGKNAVLGGIILAVIEGVSHLLMKGTAKSPRDQMLEQLEFEKSQKAAMDAEMKRKETGGPEGSGMFGSMGSMFGGGSSSSSSESSGFGSFFGGSSSSSSESASRTSSGSGFASETMFTSNDAASGGLVAEGGLVPEGAGGGGSGSNNRGFF